MTPWLEARDDIFLAGIIQEKARDYLDSDNGAKCATEGQPDNYQ
jgi:hypothetical protein